MSGRRALHFVFKEGNRRLGTKFYRDVLNMTVLRHEEFEEGCKAACNGPYDGRWSKTMIGYGPEDTHFVLELTYNYGIGSYKLGTDFRGLTIHSSKVQDHAIQHEWPMKKDGEASYLESPDGYRFYIVNEDVAGDPVQKVSLASSNLKASVDFWRDLCGMEVYSQADSTAVLGYSKDQCKLELVDIGTKVDRGTAFGRIAIGCPASQLPEIESSMKEAGQTILTPLLSLDTPGKATVQVVILADPDGHEICFVGDEAFRELSQVDPKGDSLLTKAVEGDKSDEWYAKKGRIKKAAE